MVTVVVVVDEFQRAREKYMKLSDSSNAAFELRIIQYEFPNYQCGDMDIDYYDANWLMIQIEVKHPEVGNWIARGPVLLTHELTNLKEWLEDLEQEKVFQSTLRFIEPNLSFEAVGAEKYFTKIRIYFELEFKPSWSNKLQITRDFWIDYTLSKLDLSLTIKSLQQQLEEFPPRCV